MNDANHPPDQPSTGEARPPEPAAQAASESSVSKSARRWLVLGASAVLAAVAAQNYACYGGGPVVGGAAPGESDPATLTVDLALAGAEGLTRWQRPAVVLKNLSANERQMVWGGYDVTRRLQVLWVWDFYRIQSHVALRVMLPAPDAEVNPSWQQALDAVRAAASGDTLRAEVESGCGDIHQTHTVAGPAAEWTPGQPPAQTPSQTPPQTSEQQTPDAANRADPS